MNTPSFGQQAQIPNFAPSPGLDASRQAIINNSGAVPRGPMMRRGIGGSIMMRPQGNTFGTMSRGQAMQQMPGARVEQSPITTVQQGAGVRPGNNMMTGPSVGGPGGPSLDQIQAEMARRQVGAQLGSRNGALAGYMMA